MSNNLNSSDLPTSTGVRATTGLNEGGVAGNVNPAMGNNGLETLDLYVRMRVEYLMDLQARQDELTEKFKKEKIELVDKYQKLYEPLFRERRGVVAGFIDVGGQLNSGEQGVPNFWLIAMKKNDLMAMEIMKEDEEALKYLKDITYRKLDDGHGFQLIFTFDPNPFFKNNLLIKTYHMIDEDEDMLIKAVGTVIEWFPGQSLIDYITPMKGLQNESTKKDIKYESFFNFFDPPQIPDQEDEDYNVDVVEKLQELLDLDLDIGSTIRKEIILDAVAWYTGEARIKYLAEYNQYYGNEDMKEDGDQDMKENGDEVVLENSLKRKV